MAIKHTILEQPITLTTTISIGLSEGKTLEKEINTLVPKTGRPNDDVKNRSSRVNVQRGRKFEVKILGVTPEGGHIVEVYVDGVNIAKRNAVI